MNRNYLLIPKYYRRIKLSYIFILGTLYTVTLKIQKHNICISAINYSSNTVFIIILMYFYNVIILPQNYKTDKYNYTECILQ